MKIFEKFHPSFTLARKGGLRTAHRGGLKITKLLEKFHPFYRFLEHVKVVQRQTIEVVASLRNYEIIEKFHPSFTKARKIGSSTSHRGGLKITKLRNYLKSVIRHLLKHEKVVQGQHIEWVSKLRNYLKSFIRHLLKHVRVGQGQHIEGV